MAEEVSITNNKVNPNNRVTEWETGLPSLHDLPPLSQLLISPDLASAFSITPDPHRTMTDVDRASSNTISNLQSHPLPKHKHKHKVNGFDSVVDDNIEQHEVVLDEDDELTNCSRKLRRVDDSKDGDGLKRIRLAWTPQLHKRFVEVVSYLGVKNAVPKTVMQLMNVEGLTRENVASHLQKYRLYVKRMQQGVCNHGESSSDELIGSTNNFVPDNGNAHGLVRVPMSYQPKMVYGHGFEPHSNLMMQRDWSGNNFGSV